jgi:hypothetical protein
MTQEVESPAARKASGPALTKRAPESQHTPLPTRATRGVVTPELRLAMIAEAAYYLAEHRGFDAGHDVEDWLFAESQIDAAIACGELPGVPPGR